MASLDARDGRSGADLAAEPRGVRQRDTGRSHVESIALSGGAGVDGMAAELLNGEKNGGDPDFFRCGTIFFATGVDSRGLESTPEDSRGIRCKLLICNSLRVLVVRFPPNRWQADRGNPAESRRTAAMQTDHSSTPRPEVAASAMPRLLTLRDVTQATALSRSAIYALMAESPLPEADPYWQPGGPLGRAGSAGLYRQPSPRRHRAASRLAGAETSSGAGWNRSARRPHLPDAVAPDPRASTCPRELINLAP